MIKKLPLLLLTTLSGWAIAEPAAPSLSPAVRGGYVDVAASTGFDCSPAPIGSGTMPTIRSNPAGTVAWWYCSGTNGEWRVNWAVATAEQMNVRNMYAELKAVLGATDPKAAFKAAVAKNVRVPLNSPSLMAVWQPFVAEMNAGRPVALRMAGLSADVAGTSALP